MHSVFNCKYNDVALLLHLIYLLQSKGQEHNFTKKTYNTYKNKKQSNHCDDHCSSNESNLIFINFNDTVFHYNPIHHPHRNCTLPRPAYTFPLHNKYFASTVWLKETTLLHFLKSLIRNSSIFAQKLGENIQFFDKFCPIFQ